MPPVIKVGDQNELVPTKNFPLAKFPFENFNPVQSRIFDFYDKETSMVVAASTSSGKTATAEMALSYEVRKRGGKGMYLAPMKALSEEKYSEWVENHHFSDLKISICTGDYQLTAKRKKELDAADLIIMSSEMLNSRSRNYKSENNEFLKQIGTLVVDECFPEDTLVRVSPNQDMPIAEIIENEDITTVMAYDKGVCVERKILRKIKRIRTKKLVKIYHSEGGLICTEDHKIWVKDNYKKAIELQPEDKLLLLEQPYSLIEMYIAFPRVIKVESLEDCPEYVYDLEVEDCHNYFANGILVSNCHLLTVPGRGDHLEAGLMKFTELNPTARLVLLSATMPNVEEIADWVSYTLTHRDTVLLQSTFRPCPLNLHYEKYYDGERDYESNEQQKVHQALQIIEYYPDDKFLIFAHTKRTGELMKQSLLRNNIQCEFHNADLDKKKRTELETKFKNDKNFRALIATSTLAWGCNFPARRVIILGIHRGLSEVATYDIFQEVGRAGRPGYDPVGDAYILLPEKQYDLHKERLKKPQRIESQMLDKMGEKHKVLAFHLVSEIYQGNIKDRDDVHCWYKRSLACFQAHAWDDEIVDGVIDILKKCGAIWEENGNYTITAIGKVSSMFYYSPFDVSDLKKNFKLLFESGKEDDDYHISRALGDTDSSRCNIISRLEREQMSKYAYQIEAIFGRGTVFEPAIKAGFAYHMLLNGHSNSHFAGFMRGLQFDFPRMNQVLMALDSFTGNWGKQKWFRQLQLRIAYGVKGPMAHLCEIPEIGKVRANKLWQGGFKTLEDIVANPARVKAVLGLKKERVDEIIKAAQILLLTNE